MKSVQTQLKYSLAIFGLILAMFAMGGYFGQAQAQDNSTASSGADMSSPAAFMATPLTQVQPSATPEIGTAVILADVRQALKIQYRGEVESYRTAEQEYIVAKGQWESVQTLANLENAVQKTRQVLAARDRVLLVYLDLVYTTLLDTHGVNLNQREVVAAQLKSSMDQLKAHGEQVQKSIDRDAVNARSDEFELIQIKAVSSAHKGMSLITVGKLQNVADLAKLLHDDVLETQKLATVSGLRQAERDRANQQIVRSQTELTGQLQTINQTLTANQVKDVTPASYSRTVQELGPVYANLSQILSFLKESLTY